MISRTLVKCLTCTVKPVSWAHYTKAQGGVYCGRNARIKVSKTQPDGMNRYGEKAALRPIGMATVSFEQYRPEWNPGLVATRSVLWVVESERHVWQVASRGANPNSPAASRPWTCVNNCTNLDDQVPARDVLVRLEDPPFLNGTCSTVVARPESGQGPSRRHYLCGEPQKGAKRMTTNVLDGLLPRN